MSAPNNWRDAGLDVTIFGLDARVSVFWLIWIMRLTSVMLFFVMLCATIVFGTLNYFGFSPVVAAGRSLDWLLAGRFKPGPSARFDLPGQE